MPKMEALMMDLSKAKMDKAATEAANIIKERIKPNGHEYVDGFAVAQFVRFNDKIQAELKAKNPNHKKVKIQGSNLSHICHQNRTMWKGILSAEIMHWPNTSTTSMRKLKKQ